MSKLTSDEFAWLAHEESCPDCWGHEKDIAELEKRVDLPKLRAMIEASRKNRTPITMESL